MSRRNRLRRYFGGMLGILSLASVPVCAQAQDKRPNVLVIMTDDTGWGDLGAFGGGRTRNAPTAALDRLAAEGTIFTEWYGQASCTAGRASFITGRIPVRSALSVVIAPGDPNKLRPEIPTIAEFFKKERLPDLFFGKVASRRHHRRHAGTSWLRYDERFPRVLLRRLRVHGYQSSSGFSGATIRSS